MRFHVIPISLYSVRPVELHCATALEVWSEKWMRYLSDAVFVFGLTGAVPRGAKHPGPWVGAQHAAVRSGRSWMTNDRQALLDEQIPGWRESPPPRPIT